MEDLIDEQIGEKKTELLAYYRGRAGELLTDARSRFSDSEHKERATFTNKGLIESKNNLLKVLHQKAKQEGWPAETTLGAVLLITYANYIVMMETRNDVWPYEYMAFARRIGELWEPFCQLCWEYPVKEDLSYLTPPLFTDVRTTLANNIEESVNRLNISDEEKKMLKDQYEQMWLLVNSGEINLELDLHFQTGGKKYVVDFKSGFSSNEKGNTNRLLLVASIYKGLNEDFNCLLFVRSAEELNNHYLQTLKKSELWTVYCGEETYKMIHRYTGFDLADWMKKNIDWEGDFDAKMYKHLKDQNLLQYLEW